MCTILYRESEHARSSNHYIRLIQMYSKWLKYSFGNDESDNYWKQKVVAMLKDQYREVGF